MSHRKHHLQKVLSAARGGHTSYWLTEPRSRRSLATAEHRRLTTLSSRSISQAEATDDAGSRRAISSFARIRSLVYQVL